MILSGKTYKEVIATTGCSRRTFFSRKIKLVGYNRTPSKHRDWKEVQTYYDSGKTAEESCERFGFSPSTWTYAARKGWVKSDPKRLERASDANVFAPNSKHGRSVAKKRLEKDGHGTHCSICGQLPKWNGKALVLVLDHENGIKDDNRKENLRFVCPNCNSQLPTFCARNRKRAHLTVT